MCERFVGSIKLGFILLKAGGGWGAHASRACVNLFGIGGEKSGKEKGNPASRETLYYVTETLYYRSVPFLIFF